MAITAASAAPRVEQIRSDRGVGIWLFIMAGLIGLMVVIGGFNQNDRNAHSGIADVAKVPELRDMTSGRFPGRQSAAEITCFHNYQGLGLQFAAIGAIVYREAVKRNIGLVLDDRYFTQDVHP